jgi:hypothetical protein
VRPVWNAPVCASLRGNHRVYDNDGLRFAWYYRIIPLLQEYFYQDGGRLQAVLGRRFVMMVTSNSHLFIEEGDSVGSDRSLYCINQFENDDAGFLLALKQLTGQ